MLLLLFIFLVATVNLAVGYALGSGFSLPFALPALPGIGGSKKPPADIDEGDALTKPVAAPVASNTAEPVSEAEPTPAPAAEVRAEPAVAPAAKSTPTDIMAGLANMREKLSEASIDLKQNQADPVKFDESAGKLQKANSDYLEQAQGAAEQLCDLGEAGDAAASAACNAVKNGAKKVAEISGQVDGLLEGEQDEASRAKLVKKSDAICEAAERLEKRAEEAGTEPEEPTDPASPSPDAELALPANMVANFDAMFERLESLLSSAMDNNPQHLAAVRLDPIVGHEKDQSLCEAVAVALANVSAQVLTPEQPLLGGDPMYVLLAGDSFEEATQRVERLRQQVASCSFSRGGKSVNATVTCAIAEARGDVDRDTVRDQLLLALDEAERLGTNRTFHHDGAFPTPIPEMPTDVEKQTVPV